MYARDVVRDLSLIDRSSLVDIIYEIGNDENCIVPSMILAVKLADELAIQRGVEYSKELATVCLVLACKYYEDRSFDKIAFARDYCRNKLVIDMEYEIADYYKFDLNRNTYCDILGKTLPIDDIGNMFFSREFRKFSYIICHTGDLLSMDQEEIANYIAKPDGLLHG